MSEHAANLVHQAVSQIKMLRRNELDGYLALGELLLTLKSCGRKAWESYDSSLSTWGHLLASIGVKPDYASKAMLIAKNFGSMIEKEDITPSIRSMIALLPHLDSLNSAGLTLEYLIRCQPDVMPQADLLRELAEKGGKPNSETCPHAEKETWTKCKHCNQWDKQG